MGDIDKRRLKRVFVVIGRLSIGTKRVKYSIYLLYPIQITTLFMNIKVYLFSRFVVVVG